MNLEDPDDFQQCLQNQIARTMRRMRRAKLKEKRSCNNESLFDRIMQARNSQETKADETTRLTQHEINKEEIVMKVSDQMKKRLAKHDNLSISLLATLQVMTKHRPSKFAVSENNTLKSKEQTTLNNDDLEILKPGGSNCSTESKTSVAIPKQNVRDSVSAHSAVGKKDKVIVSKKTQMKFVPNSSAKRVRAVTKTSQLNSVRPHSKTSQKPTKNPSSSPTLKETSRNPSPINNNTQCCTGEDRRTSPERKQMTTPIVGKKEAATISLTNTNSGNVKTPNNKKTITTHRNNTRKALEHKKDTNSVKAHKSEFPSGKEHEAGERAQSLNSSAQSHGLTLSEQTPNGDNDGAYKPNVRPIDFQNKSPRTNKVNKSVDITNKNRTEISGYPNSLIRKTYQNGESNIIGNKSQMRSNDDQKTQPDSDHKLKSKTSAVVGNQSQDITSGTEDFTTFKTRNIKAETSNSGVLFERTSHRSLTRRSLDSVTRQKEGITLQTKGLHRSKSNRDVIVSNGTPRGMNFPHPTKSEKEPRKVSSATVKATDVTGIDEKKQIVSSQRTEMKGTRAVKVAAKSVNTAISDSFKMDESIVDNVDKSEHKILSSNLKSSDQLSVPNGGRTELVKQKGETLKIRKPTVNINKTNNRPLENSCAQSRTSGINITNESVEVDNVKTEQRRVVSNCKSPDALATRTSRRNELDNQQKDTSNPATSTVNIGRYGNRQLRTDVGQNGISSETGAANGSNGDDVSKMEQKKLPSPLKSSGVSPLQNETKKERVNQNRKTVKTKPVKN